MNKKKVIAAAATGLLLIITFAAFTPILKNTFINLDDDRYVIDNPAIKVLSPGNIKHIFLSFHEGNYHPLALLTYALEYHFFRLNPFVYHATNLGLHLVNALFVFWLFFMLTGRIPVSFLTAILFAIHPLHVESVAWISERRDVLYSVFFFGSIISYIYYMKYGLKRYYFLSLALFIFSLFSKAMAITLPFVMLLCNYLPGRRLDKKCLAEVSPFFIPALIFGVITFFARYMSKDITPASFQFFYNIFIASHAIVFYFCKTILPLKLSIFYIYRGLPLYMTSGVAELTRLPFEFLISPVFSLLWLVAAFFSVKYTRKVLFGSLFFLITLLPVLQIFRSNTAMAAADRYTYVPLVGIFYILAEGVMWLSGRMKKISRIFLPVILIGIILPLFFFTRHRCGVWGDSLKLWNDVIANYPDSPPAYNNRGVIFFGTGDLKKAYQDFMRALSYDKNFLYYLNLGNVYCAMDKTKEAREIFEKLVKLYPRVADGYFNLAGIYEKLNDKFKAVELYNKAIECKPNDALAYCNIGEIYASLDKKEEAEKMFRKAIEIDPTYDAPYLSLAGIYRTSGEDRELTALYKKAIANDLDYFDAYYNTAKFYSDNNDDSKAIPLYKRAIKINPNVAEAYVGLGSSYCAIGKNKQAVRFLKKAIEINAAIPVAYNNLAIACYYLKEYGEAVRYCDKAIALRYKVTPHFLDLLKPYRK